MYLTDLIDKYLVYMEYEKNMSPKTLENYSLWLNRLVEQVGDIEVHLLNRMQLLDRRMNLHKQGLSKQTINYHIIAVRAFLKFCHKMDIDCMAPDKLELAKTPGKKVSFLTQDEVQRILEAPELYEKNELKQWRDKAMLWTLYGSGLRVTELVNVTIQQIPTDSDQFSLVGKGNKVRSVFLVKEAHQVIIDYLSHRHDDNPYLFISLSNNKMGNA